MTLDSASFNRNSGGFGGGAYLAGANSSRNAVVASNFTNNVASGGAGQGAALAISCLESSEAFRDCDHVTCLSRFCFAMLAEVARCF